MSTPESTDFSFWESQYGTATGLYHPDPAYIIQEANCAPVNHSKIELRMPDPEVSETYLREWCEIVNTEFGAKGYNLAVVTKLLLRSKNSPSASGIKYERLKLEDPEGQIDGGFVVGSFKSVFLRPGITDLHPGPMTHYAPFAILTDALDLTTDSPLTRFPEQQVVVPLVDMSLLVLNLQEQTAQ